MGREFEMKYTATPEKLAAVRALWDTWAETEMETTYFDAADGQLSAQNCTLRCRMENSAPVCTLKTPTNDLGRGEWEALEPWSKKIVGFLFAAAGRAPVPFEALTPVCGARFTRLSRMVELPGCTVEIALDTGVLLGGEKQLPLCELEIEVKSGSEAAASAWAQHFAHRFDLQPEAKSKFRRASLLAKGE